MTQFFGRLSKRALRKLGCYIKEFDYLGVLQVLTIGGVTFGHLLLLDYICTALIMENVPKVETIFNEPAHMPAYQGLYVSDADAEGNILIYYLKTNSVQLLTREEALQLKYMFMRKIVSLEEKNPSIRKQQYRDLLRFIYVIEYCFFDNHFVRDKNGILVLNDDLTIKTIEHPADIKKIFAQIYPDLTSLDTSRRQGLEKSHDAFFINPDNNPSPFTPLEKARMVIPTFEVNGRYPRGNSNYFFIKAQRGANGEDYRLTIAYKPTPIDGLRLQEEEDQGDYIRQQFRINKGFFQFCVDFVEHLNTNKEREPILLEMLEKTGICSPANIRLYKMGFLTASELKARQEKDYDFHISTVEGRALVRERELEDEPVENYYPFHTKRHGWGHGSLHRPPLYYKYDRGLTAPFLVDVKLREVTNKAATLYELFLERDHANGETSLATGTFKNYVYLYRLGYFKQSAKMTTLVEYLLMYDGPIVKGRGGKGSHETEMFLRLFILEDKPFNDLQAYFGLTDVDMAEIRHTPKRLNFFLCFYHEFKEKIDSLSVKERGQLWYEWRTTHKIKKLF